MKIKIKHTQHKIDIDNEVLSPCTLSRSFIGFHVSTCNSYGIMRTHDMPLNNYKAHNITLIVCLTGLGPHASAALVVYDNTWNYRVES